MGGDWGPQLTLSENRLTRSDFDRAVLEVAPALLGCVVRHVTEQGAVAVRVTEVEAYAGEGQDPSSHAHRGQTARNSSMFSKAGTLYVYFTYGMHWCTNIACGPPGSAAAVLLRAGEVVEGHSIARERRPAARGLVDLARGPARLASALGIDGSMDGVDVCARSTPLRVYEGEPAPASLLRSGPRVGLNGAGAQPPWRFWIDGEPTVSRWRAGRSSTRR